jgi:Na+/proline symporter
MCVIFLGLVIALVTVFVLLPSSVSAGDAVYLAGAAGRLNAVTTRFDWADRFNLWSGLLGGTFLFLSYFGCDQSQVQRYLTGRSISQSRLSLLFNAIAKIPMQFFILFIGAMVFVFYLFAEPPVLFRSNELERIQGRADYPAVEAEYRRAYDHRRQSALALAGAHHSGDRTAESRAKAEYRAAQDEVDASRARAFALVKQTGGEANDTNYIFLSFVIRYLPVGLVGLVIAVIFAATMSASSGEINSLATVTVVDIYRRHLHKRGSDHHYLVASRFATAFWGVYAVGFSWFAGGLGSLIEAVNKVGSLFYGTLLGCFVLALGFRRVGGTAAFIGMIAGEAAILATAGFTDVVWLWYNVVGAVVAVATALVITAFSGTTSAIPDRR